MRTSFLGHELWRIANVSAIRASTTADKRRSAREVGTCLVFSAATVEMFLSQALHAANTWQHLNSTIKTFAQVLGELDSKESGGTVRLKYEIAYWISAGVPVERGAKTYQALSLLIDARNALMHLKPDAHGGKRIEKMLAAFSNFGLCRVQHSPRMAWLYYLGNGKVAEWACASASAAIQDLCSSAIDPKLRHVLEIGANGLHFQYPHPHRSSLGEEV